MGSLYLVSCSVCQYGEDIHEGVGMSAAVYEPMVCKDCRRVVPVETSPPHPGGLAHAIAEPELTEPNRCPHCRGDQLEPWGGFGEAEEPQPGACPECGGDTELESIGIWD